MFDFEDEPGVLAILEQACRTRDIIAELEDGMKGEPLTNRRFRP